MPATERGNSYYQSFYDCQRKFYYSNILNLTPVAASTPLVVGSAVHAFMPVWYSSYDLANALSVALATIDTELYGLSCGEEQYREINRQVTELCEAYVTRYPTRDAEGLEVIACEEEINVILAEDILYTAKPDAIVMQDGLWYVKETKTTSLTIDNRLRQFELDAQTTGYVKCASDRYNRPFAGVIVDVIKKSTKTQPAVASPHTPIARTPEQIAEWEQEIIARHYAIEARKQGKAPWEKNTKECHRIGQYPCPFLPICTKRVEHLEEFYTTRPDKEDGI